MFSVFQWGNSRYALIACLLLFVALSRLAFLPVLADGCFVFKWDKNIDISEPEQKAIIVHDAGRQDLLLQVKYEGALEEFGWLIPVPSLPKVEKGSMEAFYELSQLTQRQFGASDLMTMSLEGRGKKEPVKVIEIKTVGAYEVAILSAEDSGSLTRWLKTHDYSIPEGKSEIVEEYIRKGWYFIAAKIQLNKGLGFKAVSSASPKDSDAAGKARKTIQKRLASGELHPLLISFDTPTCVFPLKISAVGGKPSEVSVYVLSAEPLLNKFIFDKVFEKLDKKRIEWDEAKAQREMSRETSMQNMRTMSLAFQMQPLNSTNGVPVSGGDRRDWSVEDLAAISKEGQPPAPTESLDDDYHLWPGRLLQCRRVTPDKIPQSAKSLPRLKTKSWYLTKQVWTFSPEQMHDLEFQPAIPTVAKVLPRPAGYVAAQLLPQLGSNAIPILVTASKSTDARERVNAASGLEQLRKQNLVEPLLDLFRDEMPQARLHAVRAASQNWDKQFADPLIALFRDPHPEIPSEAAGCLAAHEPAERSPVYLALLKNPEPHVRLYSLQVLSQIARDAVPQAALSEMLKDSNQDVQSSALRLIWRMKWGVVPRSDLVPLLGSSRIDIVTTAWQLLRNEGRIEPSVAPPPTGTREQQKELSSTEAATLVTNQLTTARLLGLKALQKNNDAKAVELTVPLLRDTNSIVRSRAFAVIRAVSGQNISENDPAEWEKWWAANKDTFAPRQPGQ